MNYYRSRDDAIQKIKTLISIIFKFRPNPTNKLGQINAVYIFEKV